MLKKIQHIKKLGVFEDFSWDHEVKGKSGAVQSFVDINIIYGRNYSGKTTLSRIIRALETGSVSDKYGSPLLSLKFSDNTEVTQEGLKGHGIISRVFNEDFVRENLRFITNPDDSVEPFAILGDDNNKIEKEIEDLEAELGSSDEGQESGLFLEGKGATHKYVEAYQSHKKESDSLKRQLGDKATNKEIGIKYNSERFGDQNYTISKLEGDLAEVQKPAYIPLTDEQISQYEKLIQEKPLPETPKFIPPNLSFAIFSQETSALVTKKISESDKIEELVKDAVLNRWVNEGRTHHRGNHGKCVFCDNAISQERWKELDKHFDEESEKLEKDIEALIKRIEVEKKLVNTALIINLSSFYSKFHAIISELDSVLRSSVGEYQSSLDDLVAQLMRRKDDILNAKDFFKPVDFSSDLKEVWDRYKEICIESDSFSVSLNSEQVIARKSLRLKEVLDYLVTIDYNSRLDSIETLKVNMELASREKTRISDEIIKKQGLISAKKRELNDEEKGAKKVNDYLNNFFGHKFLKLEAKKNEEGSKRIRFEIIRDGKKAYHLSEGECSLLAFCYFLAKLDDIETRGLKPIVWIDDPISSLDGNHIFFIYSLISTEVVAKGGFEQLFISTHNLDFLKYLKRLSGNYVGCGGKSIGFQKAYFVVARQGKTSTVNVMPSYLKEYVTEFNFLFHQIHKCANIGAIDDTNYITFYNFANNARKFLEIYLYYKYPDQGMNERTLNHFFGEDSVPAVLADRINNEYSHLCGVFERGAAPVEVPEMQLAARKIIERLKEDNDQYSALLRSVGEAAEV
ncbi:AAA family ATPase [Halomonas sp. IOP_6]|uniref:AAA family ATPase n=1 Tax=Halomonas sp. IOP_6 TaxID=2876583 RepID=UPI001E62FCA2|nr:AAA family ATPase [Halomonas sp. IOP_6]MCD6004649.1 AAA family ATPase [Halomonas sp. IOP_6]